MYPANADSPFENRHFLTHRPPIISPCSPLTMRTCSPLTMRRPPPIGSPHRGILCVEKIGSAAPELQEWPGAPSKPVKSTNGPFYWLTRKRAPPCRGTSVGGLLWLDFCKNRVRAGIGGWPGTATGGQIHVVHISHTHPPKEIIQALRKYLLGKKDIWIPFFVGSLWPDGGLLVCGRESGAERPGRVLPQVRAGAALPTGRGCGGVGR